MSRRGIRVLVGFALCLFAFVVSPPIRAISSVCEGAQCRVFLPVVRGPEPFIQGTQLVLIRHTDGQWLLLFGEVVNLTNQNVCVDDVRVKTYDAQGQLLEENNVTHAMLSGTLPGQRNPFMVPLYQMDGIDSYAVSFMYRVCDNSVWKDRGLTVATSAVETTPEEGSLIAGVMRNDQDVNLEMITTAATFYDAEGDVLYAVDKSYISNRLARGQTMAYRISTGYDLQGLTHSYHVQGQGRPHYFVHAQNDRPRQMGTTGRIAADVVVLKR
jgi:hypothetical protein